MKSIRGVVEAKCPHCKADAFEAEIWSFIRADSEPELKEAVLYGELNLLECPECSNFFYHEAPVVYFDPSDELLVFLMPLSYKSEEKMWREKMAADFSALRESLASELKIDYEPSVMFGADSLKAVLEESMAAADEDEAIAAAAGAMGCRVARLRPSAARAGGYPRLVPYGGAACDADSFASAALEILACGLQSSRLKKMLSDVNSDRKKFPEIR